MAIRFAALTFPLLGLQRSTLYFLHGLLFVILVLMLLILAASCLRIFLATAPPYLGHPLKFGRVGVATPIEIILFSVIFAAQDTKRLGRIIILFTFHFV